MQMGYPCLIPVAIFTPRSVAALQQCHNTAPAFPRNGLCGLARSEPNPQKETAGPAAFPQTRRSYLRLAYAAWNLSAYSERALMNAASCAGHHHSFDKASPG